MATTRALFTAILLCPLAHFQRSCVQLYLVLAVTFLARSSPESPSKRLASLMRASVLNLPFGLCSKATCGAPCFRIIRVSLLVSTPPIAIRLLLSNHSIRFCFDLQLEAKVGRHFTTIPQANGLLASLSSKFTPTFPIWGNVKVTIWPA